MIILLIVIGAIVVLLLIVALLIRNYGPTSSRRLKAGMEYSIKGKKKVMGQFKIQNKIYLMKDHILDDFYDLVKYSDYLLTRHNIPYTAAYGSLLGTVRHGGIMPWDDDADLFIHVPNAGYDEAILALKDEIERDGYELRRSYNAEYFHLCKAGASNHFPYVDWYQYYQTYSDDQLYPIKRLPFEDFEVCAPHDHLACIDVVFNKSGKNDPLNNIVHSYPLPRYYSLWIVQILKRSPWMHKTLDKIAKALFNV